jgi:soluble lytic murein transglycosylase-like protein
MNDGERRGFEPLPDSIRAAMKSFSQLVVLALLAALPALAADSAILRNGFSIQHHHRQTLGTVTRLYLDNDQSFVDIPNSEIDHFESAPDSPASQPTPPPSTTSQPFDLNRAVTAASSTYQLDPDLVTSVIRAESGFNLRARSAKGAQGLMQLMPQTASELGVRDAFDPQSNVDAGSRYLRQLLERYNFDLIKALAAYNAGPQRIDQYHGVPPYYETQAYVARIVRDFNKKKLAAKASAAAAVKKNPAPRRTASQPMSSTASRPSLTQN